MHDYTDHSFRSGRSISGGVAATTNAALKVSSVVCSICFEQHFLSLRMPLLGSDNFRQITLFGEITGSTTYALLSCSVQLLVLSSELVQVFFQATSVNYFGFLVFVCLLYEFVIASLLVVIIQSPLL